MTVLDWLNDRLRSVRRVRSNGEDEREGMLVGSMALWGHHQVTFEVHSLEQLIEDCLAYENRHQTGDKVVQLYPASASEAELAALHRDRKLLAALVQMGVRKWEHYPAALAMLEDGPGGCPCACDNHTRCARCCPYREDS